MTLTASKVYCKFVTIDTIEHKLLYGKHQKALYGLPKSALLFYCKLWGDLHAKGFEINQYDPLMANKTINGHQMMVAWHMGDLKMSHKLPAAINGIIEWLRGIYSKF